MEYRKKCKMIYLGVILYNVIGTLSVCALYPHDALGFGEWVAIPLVFTLPVSVYSFAYRYFEAEKMVPVLIIQATVLLVSLGIAWLICKYKIRNYQQGKDIKFTK